MAVLKTKTSKLPQDVAKMLKMTGDDTLNIEVNGNGVSIWVDRIESSGDGVTDEHMRDALRVMGVIVQQEKSEELKLVKQC